MATKVEEIQSLVTLFAELTKKAKAAGNALEKSLESKGTPKTLKELKELETELESIGRETKELNAIKKQQISTDQKIISLQKEEQKTLIKSKLALAEKTKAVKDEIKANQSLTPVYDKNKKRLAQMQKQLIELSLTEKKASKSTLRLRKDVQKLNAQISKSEQAGGQYQRQVGKYPKMFSSATAAIGGAFLGFAAFTRVLGNSVKIAKEFEQSNANLASVLGVSRKEIGALTEDAKRLGAATSFSATEVSGLQTEFAKLGFNEGEILNATEATLNLAAATGSDLAEAAAIAGATMGGFGLDASETQRVTDVMAKSFSTSALDMEKFKESMKDAAPAAKAVGVDIEKTTALLGTLSNAGISGSKAGTALKAGFIELNAAGITLDESLKKIANSNDKLATATELVGKRAATSFLVLADGTEDIAALEMGLRNAGGAAEKMANEQLDTLEGSVKILNSAWEGFVLGLLSGDGAFSSISRGIVDVTTNLLNFLTVQEDATELSFEAAKALREEANESQNLLDEYESLVQDGIEPTKEEKERLDIITLQLKDHLGDSVVAINKETGAFELNTDAVREQIKIKRLSFDAEASQLASRLVGVNEDIKVAKLRQKNEKGAFESRAKQLKKIEKAQEEETRKGGNGFRFKTDKEKELFKQRKEAEEQISKAGLNNRKTATELNDLEKERIDLIAKLEELHFKESDAIALVTGAKKEAIKADEDAEDAKEGLTDAQKAYNKALKDQISILKEQQKTELLLAGDNELLKLDLRDEHLNQINALELKMIGQTSSEKKKINDKLNNDLLANDIKRIEKIIAHDKKTKADKEKADAAALKSANDITQFRLDRAVKDAKTIDEVESRSIEAAENRAQNKRRLAKGNADKLALIEVQLQAEIDDIQDKAAKARLDKQKIADDKLAKQQKEQRDAAFAVADKLLKERSDKKIAALDDEFKAIESQQSRLEDLADSGNENAAKSLALSQKRQAEITAQKEKEMQRQAQLELILSGLKTYSAKVEAGDENALGSTISDTALLIAALSQVVLPFEKGGLVEGGEQIIRINEKGKEFVLDAKTTKDLGLDKSGSKMSDFNKMMSVHANNKTIPDINEPQRFQSNEDVLNNHNEMVDALKKMPKKIDGTGYYDSAILEKLDKISSNMSRSKTKGFSIFD